MFLAKTIDNILGNIEGNTEVIAVLDGAWADPGIRDDPRVVLLHYSASIGQRAATNQAARLSKAKYLMKCDAHCAFDKGFDRKMIEAFAATGDNVTMVPVMKNLHAFDWVCPNGHRRYQGPSGPCQDCGKETTRDILWQAKPSPNSVSYCFDSAPHFQYFGAYAKRPEAQGEITETMSLQGSCWMMTREKYWELGVCDENFGSWGSQGIEVAAKTWLSGGRVLVNHNSWYAHMFRTQGGDFGFPYPISAKDQENAKSFARDLFFNDRWEKQIRPLSWLIEKFWPVPGWTDEDLKKLKANTFKFSEAMASVKPAESEPTEDEATGGVLFDANRTTNTNQTFFVNRNTEPNKELPTERLGEPTKGIIFYTDNAIKIKIGRAVQGQLKMVSDTKKMPIISSSLKKMDFGLKNIDFPHLKRGYGSMIEQILAALEQSEAEIIFFCENNILYHPSHFDFTPPDKNTFCYNQNVWFLRITDGHALHYDVSRLSGLCGYRENLLTHFRERHEMISEKGFDRNMRAAPMTNGRIKWKNMYQIAVWNSEFPNVDIRHEGNLAEVRWRKDQYRNQKLLVNWQETDDEIPGWGKTKDLIQRF
jgi:hypothetical protein